MKVTIIGGGNVGTLLSAEFSNRGHQVSLYTRDKSKWQKAITVHDTDTNTIYRSDIYCITDNLEEAVKDTEFIVVTTPAFAQKDIIKKLNELQIKNTILCFYPGTGGGEFLCQELLKRNVTICGPQRICSVARLIKYGESVKTTGKRKTMYLGVIPEKEGKKVTKIFADLFAIDTELLPNYLCVTLTPSNPILHPARLYDLFKDYGGKPYPKVPLFYEAWTVNASKILIDCDQELHSIINKIPLDLSSVKPLLEHYESHDALSLTKKLQSIEGFKKIESPIISTKDGFIPDLNSRYFTTDIPYGLLIIKDFALITDTATPNIDEIIRWYQKLSNKTYLNEDGTLYADCKNLNLPSNYHITNINKIVTFYQELGGKICKQ